MSGGLMQLVANGAQDVFLTNDPQITFWKRAFKRHTNFSIESIPQTFTGSVAFETETNCQITRSGDLIHKAYLEVVLPRIKDTCPLSIEKVWQPYVGELLIEWVNISIGGQVIDKHYGEWLHVWNELTCKNKDGYDKMVGKTIHVQEPTLYIPLVFWWNNSPGMALPLIALQYHEVRLNFKFNSLLNLLTPEARALHLDGKVFVPNQPSLNAKAYVDYVYIDMDERTRFAQSTHEYLIQQVQRTTEAVRSENMRINLNFNHPCKELVWFLVNNDNDKKCFNFTFQNEADEDADLESFVNKLKFGNRTSSTDKASASSTTDFIFNNEKNAFFNGNSYNTTYTDKAKDNKGTLKLDFNGDGGDDNFNQSYLSNNNDFSKNDGDKVSFKQMVEHVMNYDDKVNLGPVVSAIIKLNNHERFGQRPGSYFNLVQPYQHHTNVPKTNGIYTYSFALEPESEQPTGSCNFSRIDNAVLELVLNRQVCRNSDNYKVNVYATNFNVLRIMGGMGGVAFAN